MVCHNKQRTSPSSTIKKISLEKFRQAALLNDVNNAQGLAFAAQFLNMILFEEELAPESIGLQRWTGIRVAIIPDELENEFLVSMAELIENELKGLKVKSITRPIHNTHSFLGCHGAIYIVANKSLLESITVESRPAEPAYLTLLRNFAHQHPVIRANTTDSAKNKTLIDIGFCAELDLNPDNGNTLRQQLQQIICEFRTEMRIGRRWVLNRHPHVPLRIE